MKYQEGFDRTQASLFPQCIDELIEVDSEVRIIDLFVDSLPLKDLGFMEHKPIEEGRPMYHPRDLFKLYVYGYLNRIRTSRLLERECRRNVELIWLLRGLQPCFRTIAGFRSENPKLFRNTFRYFIKQLNEQNLIGKKVVAIDGSKFRAVNSKKNNYNLKKLNRQLEYIDNKVNQYVDELDREDLSESKRTEIEEKIEKQKSNRRKYRKIRRQLASSAQEQISTTDSDARSMIVHGSVIEVAYNTQTIADDKHNLVIDYEVTNNNDRKALLPMARRAKKACGVDSISVLADKGYYNGEQIASCEKEQIKTYVAPQDVPRTGLIPTADYFSEKFRYNKAKDTYTCPQGHVMKTTRHWYHKKYGKNFTRVKHYKTPQCRTCPVSHLCTRNPKGRVMERSEHAAAVERNNKRILRNTKTYSRRQQIIEHIFGTIKRQWGFDHILLKGLDKNDGEFGLMYLIYNLRRVINILGSEKLKSWIRAGFLLNLIVRAVSGVYRKIFVNDFWRELVSPVRHYRPGLGGYCTN